MEDPDEHPRHAPGILKENGFPEEYVRAVLSHGWGMVTEVEPETDAEKTL